MGRVGKHAIDVLLQHHQRRFVSGSRLFAAVHGSEEEGDYAWSYLQMYDFSHADRAMYLLNLEGANENEGIRQMPPSSVRCGLPYELYEIRDVIVGHDSIVFFLVSVPFPFQPHYKWVTYFAFIALSRAGRLCPTGSSAGCESAQSD